jgi:hypothetical protein
MKKPDDKKREAVILQFPRKRGRPRSSLPSSDTGTPELVMKRVHGETAEALDLCLERSLITREQHWCGVHLRWLFTLRYGAPGVRAIDPTHLGGIEIKLDDPAWRVAREQEFHDAMKKLTAGGHAVAVTNLCIYNERPVFLQPRAVVARRYKEAAEVLAALRDGLDTLAAHWGRQSS